MPDLYPSSTPSGVLLVGPLEPAEHLRVHLLGGGEADLEGHGLVDF